MQMGQPEAVTQAPADKIGGIKEECAELIGLTTKLLLLRCFFQRRNLDNFSKIMGRLRVD